jgi:MFS family permease
VSYRRRLPHLVLSQILGGVGVASGVAVGGLLAEDVSGSASLAGLAQTASVLGGALLAVPLAIAAERRGRAPALSAGYLIALTGAIVVIIAGVTGRFGVLLAGMALFGSGSAVGLQARYAAIDGVGPEHRGQILSTVVWATTIGAVLGPNLSGLGGRLGDAVGIPPLAGPFLFSITAFGVAAAVAATVPGGREPLARHGLGGRIRDVLGLVFARPSALAGLTAMAGAHAVMVAVMVMTPLHLGHAGASLQVVGLVISLHIAGMYALSPVSGRLTDRWGPQRTIMLGVVVLLLALLTTSGAAGTQHARVATGLILLGLGWSGCVVAGSALLSGSVPAETRTRVQGTGDLVMGLTAAAAGALAGPILDAANYGVLSLCAIGLLAPIAFLVIWSDLVGRLAEPA